MPIEFTKMATATGMSVGSSGAALGKGLAGSVASGGTTKSFADALVQLVGSVDKTAGDANAAVVGMVDKTGDVHDAMIALQRAEMTLQLTVQVRNKLVQAYQDVMRMPM